MQDEDAFGIITEGHVQMGTVLNRRMQALRVIRSAWNAHGPRVHGSYHADFLLWVVDWRRRVPLSLCFTVHLSYSS